MNETEEFAKLFRDDHGRQILVTKSSSDTNEIDYQVCTTIEGHIGRVCFSVNHPNRHIRDVLFDNLKRKDVVDFIEKNIRSENG